MDYFTESEFFKKAPNLPKKYVKNTKYGPTVCLKPDNKSVPGF